MSKLRHNERGRMGDFVAPIDKHFRKPGGPRKGIRMAGTGRDVFGHGGAHLDPMRNPGALITKERLAREMRVQANTLPTYPKDVVISARVLLKVKERSMQSDAFRAQRPFLMQALCELVVSRRRNAVS